MASTEESSGSTTLTDEPCNPPSLSVASRTDVGCKRDHNEDTVRALTDPGAHDACLLVVADGMGGHANGAQASREAAARIEALYCAGALATPDSIRAAFDDIDTALHADLDGGGTTLVIAIVRDGSVTVAHIGDSRAYLFRSGSLRQLTVDHSWVQAQVDDGHISAAQARNHPRRNVLLKALGPGRREGADILVARFLPGDTLMLCSDGLHGVVSDDEIASALTRGDDPPAVCDALVGTALRAGAPDNASVAICRCVGSVVLV